MLIRTLRRSRPAKHGVACQARDLAILGRQGFLFAELFQALFEGAHPDLSESAHLFNRKRNAWLGLAPSVAVILFRCLSDETLRTPQVPERVFFKERFNERV